jgi:GrpB-like predicted nucleotidyltransferase (UPF0157 family)
VFGELRAKIADAMGSLALAIEHIGSTSVPGLAAKSIIDIDAVIRGSDDLPKAIEALEGIGYIHRGEIAGGPPGCDAFLRAHGASVHHLFVCPRDSAELRRHLAFRDYLRSHAEAATEYASLKRDLAERFSHDNGSYTRAKTDFVEQILRRSR